MTCRQDCSMARKFKRWLPMEPATYLPGWPSLILLSQDLGRNAPLIPVWSPIQTSKSSIQSYYIWNYYDRKSTVCKSNYCKGLAIKLCCVQQRSQCRGNIHHLSCSNDNAWAKWGPKPPFFYQINPRWVAITKLQNDQPSPQSDSRLLGVECSIGCLKCSCKSHSFDGPHNGAFYRRNYYWNHQRRLGPNPKLLTTLTICSLNSFYRKPRSSLGAPRFYIRDLFLWSSSFYKSWKYQEPLKPSCPPLPPRPASGLYRTRSWPKILISLSMSQIDHLEERKVVEGKGRDV